ncbi:MAG: hypothetical protein JWR80_768 [Bradyrhizobium sp.]|nr:hypothetical protein [Bradyrhizobium sp.]
MILPSLVLSIGFDDHRTFVVAEIERGWTSIVNQLHAHLPVEPFSSWAPRLIEQPGVVELYEAGA